MVYISVEDFYKKAASFEALTRQEEIECAIQMKSGDMDARARLIQSYLPMVAGHVRGVKPHLQTLGLALYCVQALEQAVDLFDFVQDSESFSHRLSWWLRQAVAKYIAR